MSNGFILSKEALICQKKMTFFYINAIYQKRTDLKQPFGSAELHEFAIYGSREKLRLQGDRYINVIGRQPGANDVAKSLKLE